MHRREFSAGLIAGAVAFGQSLRAADKAGDKPVDKDRWGDLTATFVYDGEPSERKRLKVDKDLAVYKEPIFDSSLMVHPKSKGIANVVAWLHLAHNAKPPAIHSDYEEVFKKAVSLEIAGGELKPRITLVRVEQQLFIQNKEPGSYNLRTDFFFNPPNGELLPAGDVLRKRYHRQEAFPSPVTCTIHSWLNGHILIRNNPYMAVSDAQGKLVIKNVPVGTHTFAVWHELPGFLVDVKRDGEPVKWKSGRVTIEIKPGNNELGTIHCVPQRRDD